MIEFQCLYLEDDDDDYDTFKQTFQRAMMPINLIIERAKNPSEAFQKLDERGDKIHILFADLLMPDSKEGLNVVGYVTERHPDILIIGVSKAGGSHPGTIEEFRRRAGEVFGFFDKRLLKDDDYPYERIRSEIITAAIDKGFDLSEGEEVKVEWKPGIPGNEKLDAEIASIGITRLRKILEMISPESEVFPPHYLAPGFSGASILRIRGTNAEGKQPRNLIVKFSPDSSKLEKELLGAPEEGEPSSDIYVPYLHEKELWVYEGIYAISARFEDDAITLENWLSSPDINSRDTVQDVFDELFIQGLGKAYAESNIVAMSAMELLTPSIRTRARILISLDIIESLLTDIKADVNLKLVRDFIRLNGQIKTHPASVYPRGARICWSHGDLHTRNILIAVSARSRPRLIDTANRAERHWASDPARLCADLWITNWDRKPKSYFWEQLNTWREQIRSWLNNGSIAVEESASNRRVFDALAWIRDNLPNLFDLSKVELARWQFNLALALEFLSMSAYPDVPMPKRCLGVLAANDILTELDNAIPWL